MLTYRNISGYFISQSLFASNSTIMNTFLLLSFVVTVFFTSCSVSSAFSTVPSFKMQQLPQSMVAKSSVRHSIALNMSMMNNEQVSVNRRSYMVQMATAIATVTTVNEGMILPANAMPMVTVAEFESILRTSAKSIQIVELSGPKSETAIATLIDGTQFGILDLYESPTDPRSPLKLIATCRLYNIPTKSVGLEQAVLSLTSSGAKKKKVYMNKRVQEAAEKEREKKERMEQDELERLQELERMNARNVN